MLKLFFSRRTFQGNAFKRETWDKTNISTADANKTPRKRTEKHSLDPLLHPLLSHARVVCDGAGSQREKAARLFARLKTRIEMRY